MAGSAHTSAGDIAAIALVVGDRGRRYTLDGLRSMFFLLVNIIDKFHYLKVGLAILLAFIGLKMLGANYAEEIGLTTGVSLLIILGILVISIGASLIFPKKEVKD